MPEKPSEGNVSVGNVKSLILENKGTVNNYNYYGSKTVDPHQLPADSVDFAGREVELSQLMVQLQQPDGDRRTAAIAGMAGVGKSKLIVRAAHQLQAGFPDVQLYVDLRGADLHPKEPFDVLEGWLRAFGVDRIPQDLTECTNEYRTQLAGKRALVVLDNAQDENQIRPLLPSSSTCAVLVASRKRLVALEGAFFLDLSTMTETEALTLLRNKIGEQRVHTEEEAAKEILRLCGRLPLAIQIATATLNKRSWQNKMLANYVSRLSDEQQRLTQLQLENLAEPDVRTSFNLSYRELDENAACLFRWLGLLEGENFGVDVTAVLLETVLGTAETTLDKLLDSQLVELANDNRYRLHDLIRLFAREKLADTETLDSQDGAKRRVIQWYAEQTKQIGALLKPFSRLQIAKQSIEIKDVPLDKTVQELETSAFNWFEAERTNLLSAVVWANQLKLWSTVESFADNFSRFLGPHNYVADLKRVNQWALEASRQTNNNLEEAKALGRLGSVYTHQGEWEEAINCYLQSLDICRDTGHLDVESHGLLKLGDVYFLMEDFEKAVNYYKQGLEICPDEDQYAQGKAFCRLGAIYRRQKQWEEAIDCCQRSLESTYAVHDLSGQYLGLNLLGNVYRDQERWEQATKCHQKALEISRSQGSLQKEGSTLHNIGADYLCMGLLEDAIDYLEKSLEISRTLGNRRTEQRVIHDLEIAYFRQQQQEQITEDTSAERCLVSPDLQQITEQSQITQQSLQQPKKSIFKYQAGLLSIGTITVFLIVKLSIGHLFIALAIAALVPLAWFFLQAIQRRY